MTSTIGSAARRNHPDYAATASSDPEVVFDPAVGAALPTGASLGIQTSTGRLLGDDGGGNWGLLETPTGMVFPEAFGAQGDNPSFDDGPGLQAAIDEAEATDGIVWLHPGRQYYLIAAGIALDLSQTGIAGNGARIDATGATFTGAAIHLTRRGTGFNQYRHTPRGIDRLFLDGPGKATSVDGILYDTDQDTFSQRGYLDHVEIRAFRSGIVHNDRAYLMVNHHVMIRVCTNGVESIAGSADAGENLVFVGGTFDGCDVSILNAAGFAYRFFSTSFDYGGQIYVGAGGPTEFISCWFEHDIWDATDAAALDFANTQFRFDVDGGRVIFRGGLMQFVGTPASNIEHSHLFRLANRAHVIIDDMGAFNLGGSSGELATGDGRISVRFVGSGPKQAPAITHADVTHNILGSAGGFESGTIDMLTWVGGSAAGRQEDRNTYRHGTQTSITGNTTLGSNVVDGVADTSALAVGDLVTSSSFPAGSRISSVDSATQITMSHPSFGLTTTGESLDFSRTTGGALTLSVSSAEARTGSNSLMAEKGGAGPGQGFEARFAIPVEGMREFGLRFYYMVPAGQTAVTFNAFMTARFQRLVNTEDLATPPLVSDTQQFGSQTISVDPAAGIPWTEMVITGLNADNLSTTDGFTSMWATHAVVSFNLVGAPLGFRMHFDDMHANLL